MKKHSENVNGSTALLTVKEASKFLRLSPGTIYHWIETGRLFFVRLGKAPMGRIRIRRADLEKFVADSTVPADGAK